MEACSGILETIIKPQRGGLSAAHAKYILSLNFSAKQQVQYAKLAVKAQKGSLTSREQSLLDEFLSANALLMVLQSKARRRRSSNDRGARLEPPTATPRPRSAH